MVLSPLGNYCQEKFSKLKSNFHFNPMAEYMHENFDDADINEMFDDYKWMHNKTYDDEMKHESHKHIFRHNMRYSGASLLLAERMSAYLLLCDM